LQLGSVITTINLLSCVRFIRFGDDTRRRTVKADSRGARSDALQIAHPIQNSAEPRADGDGFDADPEVAAQLYLSTRRRLVGWSQSLVEIRSSLGLAPDGDEEPAVVPNHGFADCYTYAGDEKYRKTFVSLRRAEYRFCSFVGTKSDDGAPIPISEQHAVKITRLDTG